MKDILDELAELVATGDAGDDLAPVGAVVTAAPPQVARQAPLPMAEVQRQLAARARATAGRGLERERMAWPDEWFGPADSGAGAACRALWGEVLRLCLVDIAAVAAGVRRVDPRGLQSARDIWLSSRDFHEVAALAGLDGAAVLDRLLPALENPATARCVYDTLRGGSGRVKHVERADADG